MTETQLYLAIGVPILVNAAFVGGMLALVNGNINARMSSPEGCLEILTGKVGELSDRLAHVEERWHR